MSPPLRSSLLVLGSRRPVSAPTALITSEISSSFCGHRFHVCLSLDSKQPGLTASTGSAAVAPGPGTGGGHCEIVGKGMMGGDSGKRVKKQNREVERR